MCVYFLAAKYNYDTPHADFTEPGIGAFILILFMQLFMVVLLFIGLESKALDKEFLKKLLLNLFKKRAQPDESLGNKVST